MSSSARPRPTDDGWLVGADQAPLTLEFPGLEGYVARRGTCTGVLDAPSCAALAIVRGTARLVIVTVDIIAVDAALTTEVAGRAGLSPGELLLAPSHTHSGPAGVSPACCPSGQPVEPGVRAAVITCCASVARGALARLQISMLGWGRSEASGVAGHRNDPHATVDERVSVLVARDVGGALLAVVVHFACHPTVLGADSLVMSADLAGALRAHLAERTGASMPLLFVNGAAADVSTRFTRRSQDVAELHRLGERLAAAADRAMSVAGPVVGDLRTAFVDVALPVKQSRPRHELTRLADQLRDEAIEALSRGATTAKVRMAVTRAEGAARQAQTALEPLTARPVRLRAVGLGDLVLLTFPGEVANRVAARVERASPFRETVVVGYTDDYVGYLVDHDAHVSQSYEALASPFAPEAAAVFAANASALLDELHRLP